MGSCHSRVQVTTGTNSEILKTHPLETGNKNDQTQGRVITHVTDHTAVADQVSRKYSVDINPRRTVWTERRPSKTQEGVDYPVKPNERNMKHNAVKPGNIFTSQLKYSPIYISKYV
ncbi:hypothetical protein ACJMK2_013733 [Sinanodonta woodiana]|uniref:Uncharacterized protein n=1 Tax=Sinanodonta woodiana TaxID=1069815 RepID=A0ABD3UYE0_SINWO